jgi:dienelactone hydrolase
VEAHRRRRPARSRLLVLVLGLASVAAACGGTNARPTATSAAPATPTSGTAASGDVARLFDYDRRQPLATTTQQTWKEPGGITVASISYASPRGGQVPALLAVPSGTGPFGGVVVQHGMPSTKEEMLRAGVELARTGAAAVLIDAPFNRPEHGGPGSDPITVTSKDRDEQVQLIVDLRRAVDLLAARPDVDGERLAYYGVSYGAAMGGLLAGVEDRLKAYVLAVGDGGLVAHFTGPDDADRQELQAFPAQQRERWLQAMRPIEPINFVGRAAPAALLFQAGTKDELIPQEDTRRYYQAASQPKELRWYEAGHGLNCTARTDMVAWLARHVRIDPKRYHCTP